MLTSEKIQKTKTWVDENKESFPKTLDGSTMYYNGVKLTAEMWVLQLDATNQETVLRAYSNLRQLYKDLEVKENWNKPLMTEKEYVKKNGRIT